MTSFTTPNLKLPQYGHGDHPDFLGEINEGYMTIDREVSSLKSKSSVNEQAIEKINEDLTALKKLLEEVIKDGK